MTHNQRIGKWGEEIAVEHLSQPKYEIIARNIRTLYGEIDFIAFKRMAMPILPHMNRAQLQSLGAQSLKFLNGLILYALQPAEQLLGYVFQPRIKERFLHYFYKPVAPASLLAPTNPTVILIEEDKLRGASSGWSIFLYPKTNISEITISSNNELIMYIHI